MKEKTHKWFGDVRVGERIAIGDGTVLRVEAKSGQQARISLEFTKPTPVTRVEPGMAGFARRGVT